MSRPLTITAHGNAQLDTDVTKFGSASLKLDGTGDYITVDNPSATSALEYWFDTDRPSPPEFENNDTQLWIDLWIYPTTVSVAQTLISLPTFELKINSNNTITVIFDGETFTSGAGLAKVDTANQWYYIVFSYNGSQGVKLGLSGTQIINTVRVSLNPLVIDSEGEDLVIGCRKSGASYDNFFNGYIDSLAWRRDTPQNVTDVPSVAVSDTDRTLVAINFNGADGSTNILDFYPITHDAQSQLVSTSLLIGTATPNPSMVFIRDDYPLTWDITDSWTLIGGLRDTWWPGYRFPSVQTTLSVSAETFDRGEADLSAEFALSASALNLKITSVHLSSTCTLNAAALNLKIATSSLSTTATMQCRAEVDVQGASTLSTSTQVSVTGRILKLAEIIIEDWANLSASAEVDIQGKALLPVAANLTVKGGLLVEPNDPYDYTWDTVPGDNWNGFFKDQWEERGFFIFDDITLRSTGGLSLSGQTNLQSSTSLTANGAYLQSAQADLASASQISALADITRNASALLTTTTELRAQALNLDIASADMLAEFSVSARPGIIHDASADLEAFAALISLSDNFKSAQASLLAQFNVVCEPSLTPAIPLDPIELTTSLAATPTLTVGGLADLEAFAAVVSVGSRSPGGQVNLSAQFGLGAIPKLTLGAKSDLLVSGFLLSDGESRAPVRANANLVSTFTFTGQGDYRLLDSEFVFNILSETRTWAMASETRQQPVLEETRTEVVKSEQRGLLVLEETRALDVEFL